MLAGTLLGSAGTQGFSREFFDLVKSIGETRSKQDEDRILVQEIATLKSHLTNPNVSRDQIKEYLVRALYADMLGHDSSFAAIHAVKLASDKVILAKRTGYMFCGLCFRPQQEFLVLLVNTLQKDLASSDYLEVSAALTCCTQIVHSEVMSMVFPSVANLLLHSKDMIRRKALSALLAFYRANPSVLPLMEEKVRGMIHDSDPGTVSAALDLFQAIHARRFTYQAAADFCNLMVELIPALVSILLDIVNRKLSRDQDYHRVPAPWLQILNLLGILGNGEQQASSECYSALRTVLTHTELQSNVSFAILFEAIRTVAKLYPLQSLYELATQAVAKFVGSGNRNLQLAGLSALSQLVQINPAAIAAHQLAIVDFLDDKDDTLRLQALELLAKTTTSANVVAVVDRLLSSARDCADRDLRRHLVVRALELADRHSPDFCWYLEKIGEVFQYFPHAVPLHTAYDLIRLLETEEAQTNKDLMEKAVALMLQSMERTARPAEVVQVVAAWILGANSDKLGSTGYGPEELAEIIWDSLDAKRVFRFRASRSYLLLALTSVLLLNGKAAKGKAAIDPENKTRWTESIDRLARSGGCLKYEGFMPLYEMCLWNAKLLKEQNSTAPPRFLSMTVAPPPTEKDLDNLILKLNLKQKMEPPPVPQRIVVAAPASTWSKTRTRAATDNRQSRGSPSSGLSSESAGLAAAPSSSATGGGQERISPSLPPQFEDEFQFTKIHTFRRNDAQSSEVSRHWRFTANRNGGTESPRPAAATVVAATGATVEPAAVDASGTAAGVAAPTTSPIRKDPKYLEKKRQAAALFAGITTEDEASQEELQQQEGRQRARPAAEASAIASSTELLDLSGEDNLSQPGGIATGVGSEPSLLGRPSGSASSSSLTDDGHFAVPRRHDLVTSPLDGPTISAIQSDDGIHDGGDDLLIGIGSQNRWRRRQGMTTEAPKRITGVAESQVAVTTTAALVGKPEDLSMGWKGRLREVSPEDIAANWGAKCTEVRDSIENCQISTEEAFEIIGRTPWNVYTTQIIGSEGLGAAWLTPPDSGRTKLLAATLLSRDKSVASQDMAGQRYETFVYCCVRAGKLNLTLRTDLPERDAKRVLQLWLHEMTGETRQTVDNKREELFQFY